MKITSRRLWQTAFLVSLNLPWLGPWKMVCVPVLNCHSCPWAVFACPVGVIGYFAMWAVFPLLAVGTILLLGALFGRLLCGWVCPFGLAQDLLHRLPTPKVTLPRWTTYTKYVLLMGAVIVVPLLWGTDTYAFFCRLCPAGTLESLVPRTIAAGDWAALGSSWIRIAVTAGIVLLAVVALRSFCKILCPIGAFLAICNRFSAFSLRYDVGNCPRCEGCLENCPMDIRLEELGNGSSEVVTAPPECILCLNCTHDCKRSGLVFSFWNLLPNRRKEITSEAVPK